MTAKEYLSEIQKLRRQIGHIENKLTELRAKAEGVKAITYDDDRVKTSTENRAEDALVKLIDLEERYEDTIREYHDAIQIREEQIRTMKKPEHVELLMLRYVEDDGSGRQLTFDQIADRMGYSRDHVNKMHGGALNEFERTFLKDDIK